MPAVVQADQVGAPWRSHNRRLVLGLVAAGLALVAAAALSVLVGARPIPPDVVFDAIFHRDPDSLEHDVVWESRVPRTVLAIAIGPALGVCGALIQAYTRNPLADPGILGVSAGAGLGVIIAVGIFGIVAPGGFIWFALVGAFLATVVVYAVGSAAKPVTPERLTLAGVAVGAVLSGIGTGMTLRNQDVFAVLRYWGIGSLSGRPLEELEVLSPFLLVGLALAFALAASLNAFALGEDLGRSLGGRVGTTRTLTIVAVTLLAGTATALGGPILFVGLMVPHVVRWYTGPDQRWVIAYSTILAAILLLVSDVIGRLLLPSGEVPVGIVTSFVGAPVLIMLVRRRRARPQ